MGMLLKHGVSPRDVEKYSDDLDFPLFVEKMLEASDEKRTADSILIADAVMWGMLAVQGKKGLSAFQEWRREQVDKLNKIEKPVGPTVFQQLQGKTVTLAQRFGCLTGS